MNILGGRHCHPLLKDLGKILRIGEAATRGNIIDRCKALINECASALDPHNVQIFYNAYPHITFERGGQIFFVVGKLAADRFQGEGGRGKVIVDVFFDLKSNVAFGGHFLTRGTEMVSNLRKGVKKNAFADPVGQFGIGIDAVFPKRGQLVIAVKQAIPLGDF